MFIFYNKNYSTLSVFFWIIKIGLTKMKRVLMNMFHHRIFSEVMFNYFKNITNWHLGTFTNWKGLMRTHSKTNFKEPAPQSSWLVYFGMVLVFSPVLIYFYSIYAYTTNIPFSDDYNRLNRIVPIIQSGTLQEKLKILFII